MKKKRIGKLPPRFTFILNSYKQTRVSKCPLCRRLTHMRKFALLIYIKDWGMLSLGKTCRYCTPCELIIAHQDELEDELVGVFERHAPEIIGNPYVVLGTVDKERWKASLERGVEELGKSLEHIADFKKVLDFKLTGGWQPVKNK
jgi:hypothetical protein